jgi:pilus assembly protein CpaE
MSEMPEVRDFSEVSGGEPEAVSTGRIVVVASAKGGVGRTTVATNFAAALHAAGLRVCLVDLDLEFGDIALSLGITPVRTLLDAVEAVIPDDIADPLELLKTEFRAGFDCVLAPVDPGAVRTIPGTLVADLLPALAETYDWVVVDTSAHQSPHVTAALRSADGILLVATPDLLNAKAVHLLTDLIDIVGSGARQFLIINREPANEAASAGLATQEFVSAVDVPFALGLPDSIDVPRALMNGSPLVLDDPGHPFSAQFRALVQSWVGAADQPADVDRRRRRRGLRKGKKS